MASYTFKVSTDDLDRAVGTFDTYRTNCVSTAKKIMQVSSSLQGSWRGDAATKFYQKLRDIQGDINDVNNIINEHVKDLKDISAKYKDAERKAESEASKLQTDVIKF
jgi:WXG100 family type VII secretion target